MNKKQLAGKVADKSNMSKIQAEKVIDTVLALLLIVIYIGIAWRLERKK